MVFTTKLRHCPESLNGSIHNVSSLFNLEDNLFPTVIIVFYNNTAAVLFLIKSEVNLVIDNKKDNYVLHFSSSETEAQTSS